MTGLWIAAAVVGVLLAAVVVTIAQRRYQSGTWMRLRFDAATETGYARTPVGSAEVALTMHPDIGKCYAIRTHFRGERERITYTLPTIVMASRSINEQVAKNQTRRGIVRR